MKPILAILVLTVSIFLDVGAQDTRSKVRRTSDTSATNIDEAYKVYGTYIRQAALRTTQKAPVSEIVVQEQIPEATQPCTTEVAKWWQEVRTAAKEAVDAMRQRSKAMRASFITRRNSPGNDNDLPQKERDKLEADIAIAKEKFSRLLAEAQVRSYRAPIGDLPPVIIYKGFPLYTEIAHNNKATGVVNMQVEFRSDGTIGDVKIVTGLGDKSDERAIKAVRQIIFLPSVKDGRFITMMKELKTVFPRI
jgi:hypothetical protein